MFGFIAYEGSELEEDKVKQAFARIQARGPDVSRLLRTKDFCFAFHRLAIMDPSE